MAGESFSLPPSNHFKPSDLQVFGEKKEPPSFPREIIPRIWFKKDDTFMVPKGAIFWVIEGKAISSCISSFVLLSLWTRMFNDDVEESLYASKVAGLSYDIDPCPFGIQIRAEGFSDKLVFLLEKIQSFMDAFDSKSLSRFFVIKDSLEKKWKNSELGLPYRQTDSLMSFLLEENSFGNRQLLESLRSVTTVGSLESLYRKLFSEKRITGLFVGNFQEEAIVQKLNGSSFYSPEVSSGAPNIRRTRAAELPLGRTVFRRSVDDPNSSIRMHYQASAQNVEMHIRNTQAQPRLNLYLCVFCILAGDGRKRQRLCVCPAVCPDVFRGVFRPAENQGPAGIHCQDECPPQRKCLRSRFCNPIFEAPGVSVRKNKTICVRLHEVDGRNNVRR